VNEPLLIEKPEGMATSEVVLVKAPAPPAPAIIPVSVTQSKEPLPPRNPPLIVDSPMASKLAEADAALG
jgi:hypothetical protein